MRGVLWLSSIRNDLCVSSRPSGSPHRGCGDVEMDLGMWRISTSQCGDSPHPGKQRSILPNPYFQCFSVSFVSCSTSAVTSCRFRCYWWHSVVLCTKKQQWAVKSVRSQGNVHVSSIMGESLCDSMDPPIDHLQHCNSLLMRGQSAPTLNCSVLITFPVLFLQ